MKAKVVKIKGQCPHCKIEFYQQTVLLIAPKIWGIQCECGAIVSNNYLSQNPQGLLEWYLNMGGKDAHTQTDRPEI